MYSLAISHPPLTADVMPKRVQNRWLVGCASNVILDFVTQWRENERRIVKETQPRGRSKKETFCTKRKSNRKVRWHVPRRSPKRSLSKLRSSWWNGCLLVCIAALLEKTAYQLLYTDVGVFLDLNNPYLWRNIALTVRTPSRKFLLFFCINISCLVKSRLTTNHYPIKKLFSNWLPAAVLKRRFSRGREPAAGGRRVFSVCSCATKKEHKAEIGCVLRCFMRQRKTTLISYDSSKDTANGLRACLLLWGEKKILKSASVLQWKVWKLVLGTILDSVREPLVLSRFYLEVNY